MTGGAGAAIMRTGHDAAHRDVVEGIACLTRLACGSIGLVRAALCDD